MTSPPKVSVVIPIKGRPKLFELTARSLMQQTYPHWEAVVVDDGWLTLEGLVDWEYQRHIAGREVRGVAGVRGVTNNIVVRPAVPVPGPRDLPDTTLFPTRMSAH